MHAPSNHKRIKSRINSVKNLILKKKERRIPSKEEVIAIYEKRVAELDKKQSVVAPPRKYADGKSKKKLSNT